MPRFVSKPILTSQTAGERLAKVREGNGLSLPEVARKIRIKPCYLEAIESGRYNELPGDIYTLEFVKTYARFLRLQPEAVAEEYAHERQRHAPKIGEPKPIRPRPSPAAFVKGGLWLSCLAAAVYGLSALRVFLLPPGLEVFSPALYYESTGSLVVLSGRAEPPSRLFINNKEIQAGAQGDFSETLNLSPGLTLLKISAQDKRGRTTTAYRAVRTGAAVAGESVERTLFYGPLADPN